MSEVMLFVAAFWAYFKHAMYPMGELSPLKDGVWPPEGIETFDPWHLPLINTLILLLSGVQFLILGVLGEYVGRAFLSANGKPQGVVREAIGPAAAGGKALIAGTCATTAPRLPGVAGEAPAEDGPAGAAAPRRVGALS